MTVGITAEATVRVLNTIVGCAGEAGYLYKIIL